MQGFILYLNLWGATAKLVANDDGGVYLKSGDLLACQQHFHRILADSNLEVRVAGDFAYIFSTDLNILVAEAATIFRQMLSPINELSLWPLRGAIAAAPSLDPSAERFMGRGIVESALVEKSALKGLRLFVTSEALNLATVPLPFKHRTSMVRGTEHFEINWLPVSDSQAHLRLFETLSTCANHLLSCDSNYCRQLGSSIKDLLRWTQGN